jgi:hypothetical protein
MTDTYTAGDFLHKLNEGALRTPLICEGFAKPVEGSREIFLFSPGTSCKNWTKIPGEAIEKVEILGEQSCREHSHPLIRIYFKEPPANDSLAVVFASLLRVSSPAPINPQMMMMQMTNDEQIAPFIGEWMARVFADAVWYGASGGGGGHSPVDVLERKLCLELRRRCKRGDMKACRQMADEC